VAGAHPFGQRGQPLVQGHFVSGRGDARRVFQGLVFDRCIVERAPPEALAGDVSLDGVHHGEQGAAGIVGMARDVGVDEVEDGSGLLGQVRADEFILAGEEAIDGHLAQPGGAH